MARHAALTLARRDGGTHIVLSPLELLQRLAALAPRPRRHLIRFHGVPAPNAGLRAATGPGRARQQGEPAEEHAPAAARLSRARPLKREFGIEHRAPCGGGWRIIAAVEAPATITGILARPGFSTRPPPRPRRAGSGR